LNAGKALDAQEQAVYFKMWSDGFADIPFDRLSVAFVACLRSHAFKTMPSIADIRKHIDKAKGNCGEEQAALKWDEVRKMIRLHYSPDIPWHGPKISERTQRAINAAGGMAYIAECIGDDLVFARKRFIESYLRWDELKQDEYLLPDGEVKRLLADVARAKALPAPESGKKEPEKGTS
jgi:hypothetical protein